MIDQRNLDNYAVQVGLINNPWLKVHFRNLKSFHITRVIPLEVNNLKGTDYIILLNQLMKLEEN